MSFAFFRPVKWSDSRPWRIDLSVWTQLLILVIGINAGALFMACSTVAAGFFRVGPLAAETGFQFGLLFATLVAMAWVFPRGHLADKLGVRRCNRTDWKIIFCGLGAIYLFQFCSMPPWGWLLRRAGIPFSEHQPLLEICSQVTTAEFCGLLLLVGVVIPVAEELVFRRLLFGVLRPLGGGVALVCGALVFSALHCFLYGFLALWMMGAVFQWIYLKTGNLLAAVTAHMILNILALFTAFGYGA